MGLSKERAWEEQQREEEAEFLISVVYKNLRPPLFFLEFDKVICVDKPGKLGNGDRQNEALYASFC
jgi:hypothetical protein